jgi:hypothetical protein
MSGEPIDPERLAAFLDGRLPAEQRTETLRQIAESPELLQLVASVARRGSNPFQPRGPTRRGTFAGRRKEMERLSSLLRQTRAGNGTNVLVTGEPRAGKSSLLIQFKAVAEEKTGLTSPFLVVHTDIDHNTTQEGLLAKIEAGLQRSLTKSERVRTFFHRLLNFASRVEAAGFRYHETHAPRDAALMERFADRLAHTVNAVTRRRRWPLRTRHDGVLLIIDEADKASPDLRLGSFLKLLAERLKWRECDRFMVAVSGLCELEYVLRSDDAIHLFEVIELQEMDVLGGMEIVVEGLKRASQDGDRITIQPVALEKLLKMADGLPHFTQQLAYSAFEVNADDTIDEEDLVEGAYGPEDAVASLGKHYGWSNLPVGSDAGWAVLKTLADAPEGGVLLTSLVQGTGAAARKVREAVQRLAEERLAVVQPGPEASVRLASHALRAWIRLETARPPE